MSGASLRMTSSFQIKLPAVKEPNELKRNLCKLMKIYFPEILDFKMNHFYKHFYHFVSQIV